MLYLINVNVIKTYYPSGETEAEGINHIVEAESESDAMDKVQTYYTNKDIDSCVSHWATLNYCNEIIS